MDNLLDIHTVYSHMPNDIIYLSHTIGHTLLAYDNHGYITDITGQLYEDNPLKLRWRFAIFLSTQNYVK